MHINVRVAQVFSHPAKRPLLMCALILKCPNGFSVAKNCVICKWKHQQQIKKMPEKEMSKTKTKTKNIGKGNYNRFNSEHKINLNIQLINHSVAILQRTAFALHSCTFRCDKNMWAKQNNLWSMTFDNYIELRSVCICSHICARLNCHHRCVYAYMPCNICRAHSKTNSTPFN